MNYHDRQRESPQELESVLSVLRHQLGNSVNALKIGLDVLRENYDSFDHTKRKVYLERIARVVGQQQEIVQALKMYSMFSVEDRRAISFSAFWRQLLPIITRRVEKHAVRLITRHESTDCTVRGNLAALNKVVLSVVDNALEALDGRKSAVIEVYTAGGGSQVRIGIRDNGPGCRPEEVDRLFVPLFTTRPGKMGMGLAIARKLAFEMHGDIVMHSAPGRGSHVVICFAAHDCE